MGERPAKLARWTGTTTQRGYGHAHQSERERRLAAYQPGDPCAHGGEPLTYPKASAADYLDLPHLADRSGYLPGLSCRKHNRGEGATRGNKARGLARAAPKRRSAVSAWRTSRDW